jgi:hypothetical protein
MSFSCARWFLYKVPNRTNPCTVIGTYMHDRHTTNHPWARIPDWRGVFAGNRPCFVHVGSTVLSRFYTLDTLLSFLLRYQVTISCSRLFHCRSLCMSSNLEAGSIYLASSLQPATKSRSLDDEQSLGQSSGRHVPTDNYGRTGC